MTTEVCEQEVIGERSPVEELENLQGKLARAEDDFAVQIKQILLACYWQFSRLRTDQDEWSRLVLAAKACGAVHNNVPFGDTAKMMRLIVRFVAHRQNKSRSQLFKYAAALTEVFNEHPHEEQVDERIGSLLIETTYKDFASRSNPPSIEARSADAGVIRSGDPFELDKGSIGLPEVTNSDVAVPRFPPDTYCAPGMIWLHLFGSPPAIEQLLAAPGRHRIEVEVYQLDSNGWRVAALQGSSIAVAVTADS
ncbi:MAG TPA: hypothetical protein VGN98_05830 [Tianweitania sediminis]|nr:hypothetical protein [Tianweitania sediminis]